MSILQVNAVKKYIPLALEGIRCRLFPMSPLRWKKENM